MNLGKMAIASTPMRMPVRPITAFRTREGPIPDIGEWVQKRWLVRSRHKAESAHMVMGRKVKITKIGQN